MTENKKLEMKAYEAFIRRASIIDFPFMLKGSYVTRQYFENPNIRIPADLDFIYLDKLYDEQTAKQKFNEWATLVTEFEIEDNVKFRSFTENQFWRSIDYAMADDFPTVNTDLECTVNGEKLDFSLDISFNLDIEQPPIPLLYRPLEGEPFLVPNTVPISLQVAWKIHQTLVRPRFKDLFDLMYLVQHTTFDKNSLDNSIKAIINECKKDNIGLYNLKYFLNFELHMLFPNNSIKEYWNYWRHDIKEKNYSSNIVYFDKAELITNIEKLPSELSDFLKQFKEILNRKGININLIYDLEIPDRKENLKVNEEFENFLIEEKKIDIQKNAECLNQDEKKINIWHRLKRLFK